MPINVNNAEADGLTRKFARMSGVGITEAIVIAMRGLRRLTGASSPAKPSPAKSPVEPAR